MAAEMASCRSCFASPLQERYFWIFLPDNLVSFCFFYRCRSFFIAFYKDSIFILILDISFSLEDIFPMQKSSKPKVLEVLAFATASASPLIKQQRLSGK